MISLDKIKYKIKKTFPKWYASHLYKKSFRKRINWSRPTEFNEKLRWLQFKTDTSKWTILADKYKVREYLINKGYGGILVKLYGVWNNANDIDFSLLPERFVLKTNHGSGSVYVIDDKSKIDKKHLRQMLNYDLSQSYGVYTAEPHYFRINPVIIAEEFLGSQELSSSVIDYKFYCIHGDSQFCAVMFNRNFSDHKYNVRLYDNDWNDISSLLAPHVDIGKTEIPKPENFDYMLQLCKDICKEFPFVRMDFYESNGKLYFGEFTFTPAACTGGSLGIEACKVLSDKIKLPIR